jgi:hypothetical protein
MLTDQEIEAGKARTRYSLGDDILHEHPDCIRMAYEWLDAQRLVKTSKARTRPVKHLVEKWAGRYVSTSDVEVAATLHPRIVGAYPRFNLSARLVLPNDRRLAGIGQAFSQNYRDRIDRTAYASTEV